MLIGVLICSVLVFGYACAAPADETVDTAKVVSTTDLKSNDLNTDASTYHGSYPGRNYVTHGVIGVVGYGYLDDKHTPYHGSAYDYGAYDRGYHDYDGYGGYARGYKGYVGGYKDYDGGYKSYGGGYKGYGGGYSGYDHGYGYGLNSLAGNGGYGGYEGNGGLHSYYGYNSPTYEGAYHLGYGYYGKHRGHGNIYNSGITPSLVTGYRGYSKR